MAEQVTPTLHTITRRPILLYDGEERGMPAYRRFKINSPTVLFQVASFSEGYMVIPYDEASHGIEASVPLEMSLMHKSVAQPEEPGRAYVFPIDLIVLNTLKREYLRNPVVVNEETVAQIVSEGSLPRDKRKDVQKSLDCKFIAMEEEIEVLKQMTEEYVAVMTILNRRSDHLRPCP